MGFYIPFQALRLIFLITALFHARCVADVAAKFNINIFEVIHVPVLPIYEQLSVFDPVTMVNNGNGIDLFINPAYKKNCIRGGVLGNESYVGYQIRYNFNASIFGTSDLTFNGFGTPLVVDNFWYNAKYGSAVKAASFPDGILVIRNSVRIGAPNIFFPPFEAALNQVQKVSSRTNTFLAVGFYFFAPNGLRRFYYSYRGYYSNTLGEIPLKYNLATVIVTPLEYSQSISINQFRAFQKLLVGGQTLQGTSPNFFKQPKTQVYCNRGLILVKLIP